FEGLAVTADGDQVLFQVTDDFVGRLKIGGTLVPSPAFTPSAEGIFIVDADGNHLRRLADQSREAPFGVVPTDVFPYVDVGTKDSNGFSFSPDEKTVVLTDRGPGTDGTDAPQVFTLDSRTGVRRQLTHFDASSIGIAPNGLSLDVLFLDDDLIGGLVYTTP